MRNRIKRRIREILRNHLAKNPLNYDFIFVARKDSASVDFDRLENKITEFLLRLNHEKITDNAHKAL
jgi:ribonuclease P protein component